ncbi:FLYWCH zinc finger domain-containing protein [Phthorimaea operculella]|nr:FLYWCH zinc finger domain-containing protein [Phthorimaea operculella]
MASCEIIKSKNGKDQLVHQGHIYSVNKIVEDIYYWSCIKKCSEKCDVWLKTVLRENKHYIKNETVRNHNHMPDPDEIRVRRLHVQLRKRARNSMDSPAQIIQQCIQEIPTTSAPAMPSKKAMQTMIHRTRTKDLPKLPKNVTVLEIPVQFHTIHDTQFLIGHYSYNDETVSIFGTEENLRLLSKSDFWVMDGTFRCCPELYYQMYTIHGMVGDKDATNAVLPLVYAFMNKKTEHIYNIFFEILKSHTFSKLEITLAPRVIMTDFEKAAINACRLAFPQSLHKCCYFHLKQNLWKHIELAELSSDYINDSEFALQMRHIASLAYLPASKIPQAFQLLKEKVLPKKAIKVTNWFEKTYISGRFKSSKGKGQKKSLKTIFKKKPARFPPAIWSLADSIECGVPSTQNSVESWHSRWNTLLNHKKMTIFKTLLEVKKEQKNTEDEIERIKAQKGKSSNSRKRKLNERLTKQLKLSQKGKITTIDFLRGIAHIMYSKK